MILKADELRKRKSRWAQQVNTRRPNFRCGVIRLNRFMKNRIHLCLCVVLGASLISVRAADTPIQAAARAALEQKLYELDHPQAMQAPVPAKTLASVAEQPAKATANTTGTFFGKNVALQTVPAPAIPIASPATVVPVAVTPAVSLAPHLLLLLLSLLIISFLMFAFQLMKFLRQNSPGHGADQTSTRSGS